MTTLEIILIVIVWITYGVFNSWQNDWHDDEDGKEIFIIINIIFAPLALLIRLFRGVFLWKE